MTLGAEPKKVAILAVLVVIVLVALYMNSGSDSETPSPAPRAAAGPGAAGPTTAQAEKSTNARVRGGGRALASEFRPRLGSARPEDRVDQASIDPALRLDLLAKVQAIEPVAAGRNLFQFGAAPVTTPIPPVPSNVPKIPVNQPPPQPVVPPQPAVTNNTPPPPPPPAPLTLKYFGYKLSKASGQKEAYLTDGEDILRVEENQTLKQHYRVVKIALTSITIEDTQTRTTQTLTLQETQG